VKSDLFERLCAALEGGATAILLREKDLPGEELYRLGRALRRATLENGAALLVSDRVDWRWPWRPMARTSDGNRCRSRRPPRRRGPFVDRFFRAQSDGGRTRGQRRRQLPDLFADFPTPSKEGLVPTVGLEGLRAAAAVTRLPLVALGA
jgi:thiamine-phosphate pyrophosphorylase